MITPSLWSNSMSQFDRSSLDKHALLPILRKQSYTLPNTQTLITPRYIKIMAFAFMNHFQQTLTVVVATLISLPALTQEAILTPSPPSLKEMWQVIQQQQTEIRALQRANKALRENLLTQQKDAPQTLVNESISEKGEAEPDFKRDTPGGTSIALSGQMALDMGYQTKQSNPDFTSILRPTQLPSYENEYGKNGEFYASVRQSRLGITTNTPTSMGDFKTDFEFDLFGLGEDAGQTTFHLRKAWGELGQFGAGQYESVFVDLDVFPNTLDFWGPNAIAFYRNVQARWTPWRTESGSNFAISVERPGYSIGDSQLDDIIGQDDVQIDLKIPDIAAHYRHLDDWGHVQLAAILRQLKWIDTGDDPVDFSGKATGWGLNLSSSMNLGQHTFRGSLLYGEGIQNYMNDSGADVAIIASNNNTIIDGDPIPVMGIVAFFELNWNEQFTSTIGYSLQKKRPPSAVDT